MLVSLAPSLKAQTLSLLLSIVSNCDDDVLLITHTRLAEDTGDAVSIVVGAAISVVIDLYDAMVVTNPLVQRSL